MKPLDVPELPVAIQGRVTKKGKPDRRFTKGMLMLKEYLEEASGVTSVSLGAICQK